jgi:hypothetical protein
MPVAAVVGRGRVVIPCGHLDCDCARLQKIAVKAEVLKAPAHRALHSKRVSLCKSASYACSGNCSAEAGDGL